MQRKRSRGIGRDHRPPVQGQLRASGWRPAGDGLVGPNDQAHRYDQPYVVFLLVVVLLLLLVIVRSSSASSFSSSCGSWPAYHSTVSAIASINAHEANIKDLILTPNLIISYSNDRKSE